MSNVKYHSTPRRLRSKALRTEIGIDVHTVNAGAGPSNLSPGVFNSSLNSPGSSFTYSQDTEPDVVWDYSSPQPTQAGSRKKEIKITIRELLDSLNQCQKADCTNQPGQYIQLLDKWRSYKAVKSPPNKKAIAKKENKRKHTNAMEKLKEFLETLPRIHKDAPSNVRTVESVPGNTEMTLKQFIDGSDGDSMEDLWGDMDNSFIVAATQQVDALDQKPTKCVPSTIPETVPSKMAANEYSHSSAVPFAIPETVPSKMAANNHAQSSSVPFAIPQTVPSKMTNHTSNTRVPCKNSETVSSKMALKNHYIVPCKNSETVPSKMANHNFNPSDPCKNSETISFKMAAKNHCLSPIVPCKNSETVSFKMAAKKHPLSPIVPLKNSETVPSKMAASSLIHVCNNQLSDILEQLNSIDWDSDEWEEAFLGDDEDIFSSLPEDLLLGKEIPDKSSGSDTQIYSLSDQRLANSSSKSSNQNIGLSDQRLANSSSNSSNQNIGHSDQRLPNSSFNSCNQNISRSDQRLANSSSKNNNQNTGSTDSSSKNSSFRNIDHNVRLNNGTSGNSSSKNGSQNIEYNSNNQNVRLSNMSEKSKLSSLRSENDSGSNNQNVRLKNERTHLFRSNLNDKFGSKTIVKGNANTNTNANVSKPSEGVLLKDTTQQSVHEQNLSRISQYQQNKTDIATRPCTSTSSSKTSKPVDQSKAKTSQVLKSSAKNEVNLLVNKDPISQQSSVPASSWRKSKQSGERQSKPDCVVSSESKDLFGSFSDDDFEDDLCQPDVLSKIDEVENLLTQPPKCTPEEIQKKKEEALKRLRRKKR